MANDNPAGVTPFDPAEHLKTEEDIAEFLNASADMGDPKVLLNALGVVARARGMADLAKKAGLGRESLYKAFAPGAQPRYDTVYRVAAALGVNFRFSPSAAAVAAPIEDLTTLQPATRKRATRSVHRERRATAANREATDKAQRRSGR
jgi:probable addiction module antidote protein